MGFFNDLLSDALKSGRYTCSQCGARMEFEDENEDILICPSCGHSVDLDDYGSEDDFDDIIPDQLIVFYFKAKTRDAVIQ